MYFKYKAAKDTMACKRSIYLQTNDIRSYEHMQINRDKIGEFVNTPSPLVLLRKHLNLRSASLQKPGDIQQTLPQWLPSFRKKLSQSVEHRK